VGKGTSFKKRISKKNHVPIKRHVKMIREFLKYEAAGGVLLGIAAILAMFIQNSPFSHIYEALLTTPVAIQLGKFVINKPLLLWINDGLMTIFFLLVSLEIKRELVVGQLSSRKQFNLAAIAAFGGLLFPALIYSYMNWHSAEAMRGWAIPAATDIAFAVGVITLLGSRIPEALKVTLLAIAIIDDLVAILIIALYYTEHLSIVSLTMSVIAFCILWLLNQRGVNKPSPYVVVGVILWASLLKSGVHATLAGVIIAFFIPLEASDKRYSSPLRKLEHELHPWVVYCVLPIFAFANAGVSLHGLSLKQLANPITFGIMLGLFVGKQAGVMFMTWLGSVLRVCQLPTHVTWAQYYGMALITGIGFTMSLFIGALAFSDITNQTYVRLGVLLGSVTSGLVGYFILSLTTQAQTESEV